MKDHIRYMHRCLGLAQKGWRRVEPNPMVGCVIVYKGKVIGEGYHERFGKAHAEVNAINSVKDKSLLRKSTLYVNLEPCSHFGKTPPCTDLIIHSGIKYIVIGTIDPNPAVAGKGIRKLVSAGCDVKIGVLDKECKIINGRFFLQHAGNRPFVILKWAETDDHYIGVEGKRIKISGPKADKLVHEWRAEAQAIMVGTNTALTDNPRLTVRKVQGRQPLRVVLDRQLRIPGSHHLLDGSAPTLVFTAGKQASRKNVEWVNLNFKGNLLNRVLKELHRRGVKSLMVEGGAKLLKSFHQAGLYDEFRILISAKKLRGLYRGNRKKIKAPDMNGRLLEHGPIGADHLLLGQ